MSESIGDVLAVMRYEADHPESFNDLSAFVARLEAAVRTAPNRVLSDKYGKHDDMTVVDAALRHELGLGEEV